MSHRERSSYLEAMASLIEERRSDFGQLWTRQVGVLYSDAQAGVARAAEAFRFYAELGNSFDFVESHEPTSGGVSGYLVREPVGVVAAIIPWNAPAHMITYKLAPALIAGCTVVIKASSQAPGEAYIFAEIAEQVGIPAGVVNVITASREVAELVVRDPDVDKVTFTGSTAAGRRISSLCGQRIARCTLELGGKSAAIVLDDYDIEEAAQSLARSARRSTGQTCSSLTRIIVSDRRHDELVDALVAIFSSVKVGDPFDPETEMGPLATSGHRDRVENYIRSGTAEGAMLATGGGRPSELDRGFFVEPTVFARVDNGSLIARDEIFGPVLSVIAAKDEREAVSIANDSIYGLNASVFTKDTDRAWRIARELRAGTVGHNAFRSDFGIAFGGFKQSGIGREGGTEGLLPFLETKTVVLDSAPSGVLDKNDYAAQGARA